MAPSRQKALTVTAEGTVKESEVDVPKPISGEVLVKVVAAALNPTDWKTAVGAKYEGAIAGCDLAGVVEEIGPDVPEGLVTVGQRIATFVHGATLKHNGAFAQYAVVQAALAFHIPDSWTFEQAAQLGVAAFTTCQVLYQSHSFPTPLAPLTTPVDLLVYGASSAVGLLVIQFAKQAGLRVLAVASARNFPLLKSLGADAVFDYHDADVSAQIRAATGGKLKYAVDCISEGDSPKIVSGAIGDEGGRAALLLQAEYPRKDIELGLTIGYDVLGRGFKIPFERPPQPDQHEKAKEYTKLVSRLLAEGKIKPTPIVIEPNGFANANAAFERMKAGKVSGHKIIFRVADTPGWA